MSRLRQAVNTRQADPSVAQELLGPLGVADEAMQQMAALIRSWMRNRRVPVPRGEAALTLGQVIQRVVGLCSPAALEQGIKMRVVVSDQVSRLSAGPVGAILTNALINSIQAIAPAQCLNARSVPGPWRIDVEGQVRDHTVEIRVTDNGPGLHPSITDERGQARIGMTTRPDGHGLGLAQCDHVAATLNGQVQLTNGSSGGAVFTLRYPLENEGSQEIGPSRVDGPRR